MEEVKADWALEDIASWACLAVRVERLILDEIKECVAVFCEDNDIRTASVDIDATLKTARIVVTLIENEGAVKEDDI